MEAHANHYCEKYTKPIAIYQTSHYDSNNIVPGVSLPVVFLNRHIPSHGHLVSIPDILWLIFVKRWGSQNYRSTRMASCEKTRLDLLLRFISEPDCSRCICPSVSYYCPSGASSSTASSSISSSSVASWYFQKMSSKVDTRSATMSAYLLILSAGIYLSGIYRNKLANTRTWDHECCFQPRRTPTSPFLRQCTSEGRRRAYTSRWTGDKETECLKIRSLSSQLRLTWLRVRLNTSWTAVVLARHVAAWTLPTGGTADNVTDTLSGIHLSKLSPPLAQNAAKTWRTRQTYESSCAEDPVLRPMHGINHHNLLLTQCETYFSLDGQVSEQWQSEQLAGNRLLWKQSSRGIW